MKQILSERRRFQVCNILDGVAISAGIGILLEVLFFAYIAGGIGMNATCNAYIWALQDWEGWTGLSYEAINVIFFIFLEPLAVGFSVLLYFLHKYTFSHILMAIGSIAAFWLVTIVNFPSYDKIFQLSIGLIR